MKRQPKPGVRIFDTMPEGWKPVRGALTAPKGYIWIYNGKSIFSSEYEHAYLRTTY